MNFEIDGIDDMDARLEQRTQRFNQSTGRALTDVTLDLLGRSVNLAPVRDGHLRGSGNANVEGTGLGRGTKDGSVIPTGAVANPPGDVITGEVRFGGSGVPYARRQHEELHYEHPMGGQAKYLEQPLYENEGRYLQHIADAVRRSQE